MLKSMTGYGKAQRLTDTKKIVVEIKSVNNRYNDVNIRVPRAYIFLEENIRNEISKYVSRGKIDVFVTYEQFVDENKVVYADLELAKNYIDKVKELSDSFELPFDLTASKLARVQDVLTIEKSEEDHDGVWEEIKAVLNEAGQEYLAMRSREGERIGKVLEERIEAVSKILESILTRMPSIVTEYKEKLYSKISEILTDKSIDEARILTEVALFADKVSTDEETDRLNSHIEEYKKMLRSAEPIGRKMDFLIQEMNRETNTIGSKCNDTAVTKMVVELKSEIEKIREQIQNIE